MRFNADGWGKLFTGVVSVIVAVCAIFSNPTFNYQIYFPYPSEVVVANYILLVVGTALVADAFWNERGDKK